MLFRSVSGAVGAGEPGEGAPELLPVPQDEGGDRQVRAGVLRKAGWSNKRIARELEVHPSTVGRWFARAYQPDAPDPDRMGLRP